MAKRDANEPANPVADRMDAQFREIDATLDKLGARAEARQAKDEMDEISGLRSAREKARQRLDALSDDVSSDIEYTRAAVQTDLRDIEDRIEKVRDRYHAWDDARERRFNARLDEADAQLRIWKARAAGKRAEHVMKEHDELAKLEESVALARSSAAAWRYARHDRKAQEALEDAAHHLDHAFEAASKRYTD
jgi:chromosome segregation ATPase